MPGQEANVIQIEPQRYVMEIRSETANGAQLFNPQR